MLFSAKTKGFFVDSNEHGVLVARTSKPAAPLVIEEIVECAPADPAALSQALQGLNKAKTPNGYAHAACGINPSRKVVRRVTLDTKRLKEPAYLNEVVSQQIRIEPEHYALALLNPAQGSEYDLAKGTQKDALVCGLPSSDVGQLQDGLLASGVYPQTLELGTVAAIGAMVDYLNYSKIKTPVLMLEVDSEVTHSYIVTSAGLEASRPIQQGLAAMIPVVQKELGLKDEESARKLFLSNTFDFTGMGSVLVKRLIKELQSSIGFYEVQTGQSIAQVACTILPGKLSWLETCIASDLGVGVLAPSVGPWLQSRQITFADAVPVNAQDVRRFGLFGLMIQYNNNAVVSEKNQ